jgi:hypothetical protein
MKTAENAEGDADNPQPTDERDIQLEYSLDSSATSIHERSELRSA